MRYKGVTGLLALGALGLLLAGMAPGAVEEPVAGAAAMTDDTARALPEVPAAGAWGEPEHAGPAVRYTTDEHAGWSRYLGQEGYPHLLGFDKERVFFVPSSDYDSTEQLYAANLRTGEICWGPAEFAFSISSGMLTVLDADGQELLLLSNGRQFGVLAYPAQACAWQADERLLDVCDGKVWTCDVPDDWNAVPSVLTCRDLLTGEVLNRFVPGPVTGLATLGTVDGALLPVRAGDQIRVISLDGPALTFPAVVPGYFSILGLTPYGLLDLEYRHYDFNEDYDEEAYSDAWPDYVLRMLALPGGEELWRRDLRDCYISTVDFQPPPIGGQHLLLSDEQSLLDLTDGNTIPIPIPAGHQYMNFITDRLAEGLLYAMQYSGDGKMQSLARLDLPAANGWQPICEFDNANSCLLRDGYLARLIEAGGRWGYFGGNDLLSCTFLDEAGAPYPGAHTVLNLPELPTDAVAQFFATPEPLADEALMRELVRFGATSVLEIAERLAETTPAQQDALLALTCYLDQSADGFDSREALMPEIQAQPQPAYVPLLTRYAALAFPAYASMHEPGLAADKEYQLRSYLQQLVVLIGECGGPQAKAWLDHFYGEPGGITRAYQPPASQLLADLSGSASNIYDDGDYWAEGGLWADASDGADNYCAFLHDGLVSGRDVYLGIDRDGQPGYEAYLPTGLSDVFFYECHPAGWHGGPALGKLTLAVDGDTATIAHHRLHKSMTEYGEQWDPNLATHDTDTVSITALTSDADGDGLPAGVEALLLTNPEVADTDGDGINDAQDADPLCSPAQMGALERGVARALALHQLGRYSVDESFQWPWRAQYALITGCDPVPVAQTPAAWGIALADDAQQEEYWRLLGGFNHYSAVEIEVHPIGGVEEDWRSSGLNLQGFTDGVVVYFEHTTVGYMAVLQEIDGEYYPVEYYMTWIS